MLGGWRLFHTWEREYEGKKAPWKGWELQGEPARSCSWLSPWSPPSLRECHCGSESPRLLHACPQWQRPCGQSREAHGEAPVPGGTWARPTPRPRPPCRWHIAAAAAAGRARPPAAPRASPPAGSWVPRTASGSPPPVGTQESALLPHATVFFRSEEERSLAIKVMPSCFQGEQWEQSRWEACAVGERPGAPTSHQSQGWDC